MPGQDSVSRHYGFRRGDGRLMAHHQGARDVAAERAGTEQETFCMLDLVEIEGRHDAPAHQLQVQVNCLIRQSAGSSFPDQPKLSRSCETEAASETRLVGSIRGPRSAIRGPSLPFSFFSHPTVPGLCGDASISSDSTADLSRSCAVIVSLSRTRTRRSVSHGPEARRGVRERKRRMLRTGQPGADGCDDGSDTITVRCGSERLSQPREANKTRIPRERALSRLTCCWSTFDQNVDTSLSRACSVKSCDRPRATASRG